MSSWIKLHRSSLNHWLYTEKRPLTKREAWENILLCVNWEPGKSLIRGVIYECNRGESLFSLDTWAKNFNWSIQQVRSFFKLLEKDGMIKIEGLQYTTKVTICNYETYQGNDEINNKRKTNEQHTDNKPITSIKEEEEYKEKIYTPQIQKFNLWLSVNAKNVLKMQEQISDEQLTTLKSKYDIGKIQEYLLRMHNWKDLTKKNTSVYLTILNWIRKDEKKERENKI